MDNNGEIYSLVVFALKMTVDKMDEYVDDLCSILTANCKKAIQQMYRRESEPCSILEM